MSRIRGPYVRFCERDEAVTPHPTRCVLSGEINTKLDARLVAFEHHNAA